MFREAIDKALDKAKSAVDTLTKKTDTEKMLDEALSKKNWGASSTLMNDLARLTEDRMEFSVIMKEVWASLNQDGKNWRVIFKGLTLLEALIKNGSERVVDDARDHLFRIRTLTDFAYHDDGAEKGQGVREKSRQLVELLNDTAKIREERTKARELRNKYVGIGQEHGSFGSSGTSRGYSGGSSRYDDSRYDSRTNPRTSEGRFSDDGSSARRSTYDDRDRGHGDRHDRSGGPSGRVDPPGLRGFSERGETVSEDATQGDLSFDASHVPRKSSAVSTAPSKPSTSKFQIKMATDTGASSTSTSASKTPAHPPAASTDEDFDPFAGSSGTAPVRGGPAPVPAPAPVSAPTPAIPSDFDPFVSQAPPPRAPAPAPIASKPVDAFFDPFSSAPAAAVPGGVAGLGLLDFSAPTVPVPAPAPVTIAPQQTAAAAVDFGDFHAAGPKDHDVTRLVSLDGLSLTGRGEAPATKTGPQVSKGPAMSAMKPAGAPMAARPVMNSAPMGGMMPGPGPVGVMGSGPYASGRPPMGMGMPSMPGYGVPPGYPGGPMASGYGMMQPPAGYGAPPSMPGYPPSMPGYPPQYGAPQPGYPMPPRPTGW